MLFDNNLEDIIIAHQIIDELTQNFKNDANYGHKYDIDTFMLHCYHLNPQRYGLRVQNYFAYMMQYKKINASEDRGDFEDKYGQYVEFKCSFLKTYSREINVKQIRTWQPLKFYYVFTVDYADFRNIKYKTYMLTHDEMLKECELMNATSCHMTKENHEKNEKVELGFTIKEGTANFERWEKTYLLKNFDIKKACDDRLEEIHNSDVKDQLLAELLQQLKG